MLRFLSARKRPASPRPSFRPRLEVLEGRALPSGLAPLPPATNVAVNDLFGALERATAELKAKLAGLGRESISIDSMFELRMLMNHLSQLSEMSSSVVSASNSALSSLARNIKA